MKGASLNVEGLKRGDDDCLIDVVKDETYDQGIPKKDATNIGLSPERVRYDYY